MIQKLKKSVQLGKHIKALRLDAGFGVTELARHMQLMGCEITRESLNKIESGNQNITLLQLWAFIHSFEVSYDSFFSFLEED